MTRLLTRMEVDGLVKKKKLHQTAPLFFCLPKTKALNMHNYQHEQMCGDLYVAYETSGVLHTWLYDHEYIEYKRLGLKPDRSSIIGSRLVFWEVDRGTETLAKIHEKVSKYLKLSQLHGDQRFYVIFTSTPGRAKSILLEVLLNIRANAWFYVADHSRVLLDPLGAVFASPVKPDIAVSLM